MTEMFNNFTHVFYIGYGHGICLGLLLGFIAGAGAVLYFDYRSSQKGFYK